MLEATKQHMDPADFYSIVAYPHAQLVTLDN